MKNRLVWNRNRNVEMKNRLVWKMTRQEQITYLKKFFSHKYPPVSYGKSIEVYTNVLIYNQAARTGYPPPIAITLIHTIKYNNNNNNNNLINLIIKNYTIIFLL